MKNKLAYLGFLGLLGVLGIFTNPLLLCNFSYFLFFIYARVVPDELFWSNVRRSASVGFFLFSVPAAILVALCVALSAVLPEVSKILILGMVIIQTVSELAFLVCLHVLEVREKNEMSRAGKGE